MTANPYSWIWLFLVENFGACAKIIIHFDSSVIYGQSQCHCVHGLRTSSRMSGQRGDTGYIAFSKVPVMTGTIIFENPLLGKTKTLLIFKYEIKNNHLING